jgi:hypothetical protein
VPLLVALHDENRSFAVGGLKFLFGLFYLLKGAFVGIGIFVALLVLAHWWLGK